MASRAVLLPTEKKMVQCMEPRSLAKDNPVSVASSAGKNTNMGKFEVAWDGWTIKMRNVPTGGGNNATFTAGMRLGDRNLGQRGNNF